MASYDMRFACAFLDLTPQQRLSHIIDTTFPDWHRHVNEGVNLVYDNACSMIQSVTEKIFGVDPEAPVPEGAEGESFSIVSSRLALPIETGHDQFNPDAGAFAPPGTLLGAARPFLFMFETAVRAMSSEDAAFEPRFLLPQTEEERRALGNCYGEVFSVQLRFWTQDLADYPARLVAFRETLAEFPDVFIAEKVFHAPLRKPLRFRLKHKEPFDEVETAVTAIAIGRTLAPQV